MRGVMNLCVPYTVGDLTSCELLAFQEGFSVMELVTEDILIMLITELS